MSKSNHLVEPLMKSGYFMEEDKFDSYSVVVDFPVSLGTKVRTLKQVSMWEQL